MASLPTHKSHEPSGFVAPSSYLRRSRGQSHPNPTQMSYGQKTDSESAIDRDQRLGLVGLPVDALFNQNLDGGRR